MKTEPQLEISIKRQRAGYQALALAELLFIMVWSGDPIVRPVRLTYREPQPLNSSPGSPGVGGLRRTLFFWFIKEMWLGTQGNQGGQGHLPCGREGVRGGQTHPLVGTTWSPPV